MKIIMVCLVMLGLVSSTFGGLNTNGNLEALSSDLLVWKGNNGVIEYINPNESAPRSAPKLTGLVVFEPAFVSITESSWSSAGTTTTAIRISFDRGTNKVLQIENSAGLVETDWRLFNLGEQLGVLVSSNIVTWYANPTALPTSNRFFRVTGPAPATPPPE